MLFQAAELEHGLMRQYHEMVGVSWSSHIVLGSTVLSWNR
jgi:hypothetical protein